MPPLMSQVSSNKGEKPLVLDRGSENYGLQEKFGLLPRVFFYILSISSTRKELSNGYRDHRVHKTKNTGWGKCRLTVIHMENNTIFNK